MAHEKNDFDAHFDAHDLIDQGLLPPWKQGYRGLDFFMISPSYSKELYELRNLDKIKEYIKNMNHMNHHSKILSNDPYDPYDPFRITWSIDAGKAIDTFLTVWVETQSIEPNGNNPRFEIFFDFVGGVSNTYLKLMPSLLRALAKDKLIDLSPEFSEEAWKKRKIERMIERFNAQISYLEY